MRLVILCLSLLLTACGFQLRGAYTLPYESLYVDLPAGSVIGAGIKRQIRTTSTRLVDNKEEAQAIFLQVSELRERQILSLSSSGQVREVRLRFRYAFRIVDQKGRELVATTGVEQTRDNTYDDSIVLAKTQEEQLLWQDMERDIILQLMRRLAAVKPNVPTESN